jgi:GT2 family glycosyltransferase
MRDRDPPSIAFVVINKDDRGIADTLATLDDLATASPYPAETIVVDASAGKLDDVRDRYPALRWIPFAPTKRPTIAEQRNVGVANSHADVIVFIDASCVPDPGWLPALLGPIVEDGEALVAGSHRSTGRRSLHDEDAHFAGGSRYIREAPTLNLAVARTVFTRIGGFDESFSYGSDVDFTWRAVDAGYRIRYVPDAVVAHDWGSLRSEIRRAFLYGQARYRLYAKHSRRRRAAWRHDPEALAYPLLLLIAPLVLVRPRLAVLVAIPLVKNARHRPVLTVTHHLVYASGVLAAAWRDVAVTPRRRRDSQSSGGTRSG